MSTSRAKRRGVPPITSRLLLRAAHGRMEPDPPGVGRGAETCARGRRPNTRRARAGTRAPRDTCRDDRRHTVYSAGRIGDRHRAPPNRTRAPGELPRLPRLRSLEPRLRKVSVHGLPRGSPRVVLLQATRLLPRLACWPMRATVEPHAGGREQQHRRTVIVGRLRDGLTLDRLQTVTTAGPGPGPCRVPAMEARRARALFLSTKESDGAQSGSASCRRGS